MIDNEKEWNFHAAITVEEKKEEVVASSITKSNDAITSLMSSKKLSKSRVNSKERVLVLICSHEKELQKMQKMMKLRLEKVKIEEMLR